MRAESRKAKADEDTVDIVLERSVAIHHPDTGTSDVYGPGPATVPKALADALAHSPPIAETDNEGYPVEPLRPPLDTDEEEENGGEEKSTAAKAATAKKVAERKPDEQKK